MKPLDVGVRLRRCIQDTPRVAARFYQCLCMNQGLQGF
jgi:hypothetical protein